MARFTPTNAAKFRRDFHRDQESARALDPVLDDGLELYRDNLSESTAGPAKGAMRGSFAERDRDGARIGTTAPDANIIEWGTSRRAARRPLTRAAERLGEFRPN